MMIQAPAPLSSQEIRGWDWKIHPSVLSESHLININPGGVERSLLRITSHPLHLQVSAVVGGTEDKRPNIVTKDVPFAPIAQDISRVLGVCEPGTVDKDQIHIKNTYLVT